MENYNFKIANNVSQKVLKQILEIRRQHYSNDPYDSEYWSGGIQLLLDENSISIAHKSDPSSKFLLIHSNRNILIAYARFSINQKVVQSYNVSKLHILAADKKVVGKKLLINGYETKIGEFIIDKIISECRANSSDILVSEICVFPYPNLPSLHLHKKFGFEQVGNSLKSSFRNDNVENFYTILGKYFNVSKNVFDVSQL